MNIKQVKPRHDRRGIRTSEASSELWVNREWFGGGCRVTVVSIGMAGAKVTQIPSCIKTH